MILLFRRYPQCILRVKLLYVESCRIRWTIRMNDCSASSSISSRPKLFSSPGQSVLLEVFKLKLIVPQKWL